MFLLCYDVIERIRSLRGLNLIDIEEKKSTVVIKAHWL